MYIFVEVLFRLMIMTFVNTANFAPLLSLVSSNSESQIKAATVAALLYCLRYCCSNRVLPALNKLAVLKGIGPASASLLLSVCYHKNTFLF